MGVFPLGAFIERRGFFVDFANFCALRVPQVVFHLVQQSLQRVAANSRTSRKWLERVNLLV